MGKTASKKTVRKSPPAKPAAMKASGKKSATVGVSAKKSPSPQAAGGKAVGAAKASLAKAASGKSVSGKAASGKAASGKPMAGKATSKSASANGRLSPADKAPAPSKPAAKASPVKAAAKPAVVAKADSKKPQISKPADGKPTIVQLSGGAKPPMTAVKGKKGKRPIPIPSETRRDARSIRAPKPSRYEASDRVHRPTGPVLAQVETANSSGDSKPKKNQAGLTPKELEGFRDQLLAKRRELVGDMSSMEKEALAASESNLSSLPIHMADMGTDNYEQEFTLGLVEKDRNLLREINYALAKIQAGTYGLCEGSGKPIAKVRLEAQPWARFSIEFARMQEKGGMMR